MNWKGNRIRHIRGYYLQKAESHPHANCLGYVMEHILIIEKILGKYLLKPHCSHHVNGNCSDNTNKNLVVCEDQAYHNILHRRERAIKACGHANWRKCNYCKKYDIPENLYIHGQVCHRSCCTEYRRKLRKKNRECPIT